ncbi:MAG: SHOCT domain-containing protein [Candidatus Pacebacteria bacterium]|nr:SHOCT domain-containing protein [Candidatus Paceibacterota bacterium]
MMYGYYGNWGGHILGGLIMFLFWIVVIAFIIWLIRGGKSHFHHGCGHMDRNKDAIDILKERYAKGEINKEEFETKKKDLSSQN